MRATRLLIVLSRFGSLGLAACGAGADPATLHGAIPDGAWSTTHDASASDAGPRGSVAGDNDAGTSIDASTPPSDDASAPPPSGDATTGKGYLRTQGGTIVDASGAPVRLTGLSWFGLETSNFAPHGLWTRSMASMLDQIASLGFNTIRVPYTNQMLDAASTPNGIDLSKNPDLAGLTALQILDKLVDGAEARGLRIILDRHRPDASAQSELWYTGATTEKRWIDDWTMLATHYKGRATVVGFDLHNEPHGSATWGDGNAATDWRLAAERAGNAVQAVNADLLIIVEGIEKAGTTSSWWGGNLRNAGSAPVRLTVANRLVYSPHDYPASVYSQPWFSDATYPNNLPAVWDAAWGYLAKTGVAPIWVGEFGTKNETAVDQAWLKGMVAYTSQTGMSFSYWSWNPDSGDTGGILEDDWQTVHADKMTALTPGLAR